MAVKKKLCVCRTFCSVFSTGRGPLGGYGVWGRVMKKKEYCISYKLSTVRVFHLFSGFFSDLAVTFFTVDYLYEYGS